MRHRGDPTSEFSAPSHWRTVDVNNDPDGAGADESTEAYVASFSSRARPDLSALFGPVGWDDDCSGAPCDPVGAGLLQADAALMAVP